MKTITALLIVMCMGACANSHKTKQESCKALFEKHYEVNVQGFMKAMPADMDSLTARKIGECILNKLYEIDSTFVLKEGAERDAFLRKHADLYDKCDSLVRAQQ